MTGWLIRLSLVAAAISMALLPMSAPLVERYYSRAAYPALQHLVTTGSNLVPIALLDVLIGRGERQAVMKTLTAAVMADLDAMARRTERDQVRWVSVAAWRTTRPSCASRGADRRVA